MNLSTSELKTDPLVPETLQRIEELVLRELRGRLVHLQILFRGDGIVLQGKVGSFYVKQLALHAVMKVTSLPIRGNEIAVSPN
jgi:hypothetical protein